MGKTSSVFKFLPAKRSLANRPKLLPTKDSAFCNVSSHSRNLLYIMIFPRRPRRRAAPSLAASLVFLLASLDRCESKQLNNKQLSKFYKHYISFAKRTSLSVAETHSLPTLLYSIQSVPLGASARQPSILFFSSPPPLFPHVCVSVPWPNIGKFPPFSFGSHFRSFSLCVSSPTAAAAAPFRGYYVN